MARKGLRNWRRWLQNSSLALLIVAAFAPLPETLSMILLLLASLGLMTFLIADSPTSRRNTARFLIPLAALVLLALLVSVNPKWVVFGFIGLYCLWGVFKLERAEYLAERKHLR